MQISKFTESGIAEAKYTGYDSCDELDVSNELQSTGVSCDESKLQKINKYACHFNLRN